MAPVSVEPGNWFGLPTPDNVAFVKNSDLLKLSSSAFLSSERPITLKTGRFGRFYRSVSERSVMIVIDIEATYVPRYKYCIW